MGVRLQVPQQAIEQTYRSATFVSRDSAYWNNLRCLGISAAVLIVALAIVNI